MNMAWVTAAEEARDAAMIARDIDVLRDILADGLVWIHSSGKPEGKADFIARIAAGNDRYLRIERSELVFRRYGEIVVITGLSEMDVLTAGTPKQIHNRFTNIWHIETGQVRLVSCQSTRVA